MAQQALVDLLLSEKGNFIQSTLLNETARFIDAAVRERLYRITPIFVMLTNGVNTFSFAQARQSAPGQLLTNALETQNNIGKAVSQIPLIGVLVTTLQLCSEMPKTHFLACLGETYIASNRGIFKCRSFLAEKRRGRGLLETSPENLDAIWESAGRNW